MANFKIVSKFGPGSKVFTVYESKIVEATASSYSATVGDDPYNVPQLLLNMGKHNDVRFWQKESDCFKSRRALMISLNKK